MTLKSFNSVNSCLTTDKTLPKLDKNMKEKKEFASVRFCWMIITIVVTDCLRWCMPNPGMKIVIFFLVRVNIRKMIFWVFEGYEFLDRGRGSGGVLWVTPVGLGGKVPESSGYLDTLQSQKICFVTPFQPSFTVFFQWFLLTKCMYSKVCYFFSQ